MKLNERMRYPHPVLWSATGDYPLENSFGFEGDVILEELTAAPRFSFSLELKQDSLTELLLSGKLSVGVTVRCRDTYLDELRVCASGANTMQLEPLSVSGEVRLRPIAWLREAHKSTLPGVVSEFENVEFHLSVGSVMAVGEERVFYLGREKATPLSSVFELQKATELHPDLFVVDLETDRIVISAGTSAHKNISDLRNGDGHSRAVVLNTVYLPVIQEVLRTVADESARAQCEGKRWFVVLSARLQALGIALEKIEPLAHAQQLLGYPLQRLSLKEQA